MKKKVLVVLCSIYYLYGVYEYCSMMTPLHSTYVAILYGVYEPGASVCRL